jgi:pyruvate dehydrogenase E1 component alpha subunit
VDEENWLCGSWRQHYKALLKGVPQEELMQAILEGKSISLCFPKYRVISSAIVGGILPIGVGIAMGIKRKGEKNKVIIFAGEMTAESGCFYECYKYSINHDLPVLFCIEDNGKSVCTDTREVWGCNKLFLSGKRLSYEPLDYKIGTVVNVHEKILYYKYESKFPHAGTGERISF